MALAGPRWRILAGSPVNAVGAAICRPENSAELPAGQCTPHFLFGLARKENGPYPQGVRRIRKRQSRQRLRSARSKRKGRLGALRCGGPPCARGSAYWCLLRFWPAFGHAIIFCEVDAAVPWRTVRRASGWLSYCHCFSFRCRLRSRAEEPAAAKIGAGCILLPPRAKGFPKGRAFPSLTSTRDSQPSPAGGRRSALAQTDPPKHFFFSTGRGAEGELPRRGKRGPSGGFSF